jgi:hypothetical protein
MRHKIVDLVVNNIETAPFFTTTIDCGFCSLIASFDDCLWLFIVQIISLGLQICTCNELQCRKI